MTNICLCVFLWILELELFEECHGLKYPNAVLNFISHTRSQIWLILACFRSIRKSNVAHNFKCTISITASFPHILFLCTIFFSSCLTLWFKWIFKFQMFLFTSHNAGEVNLNSNSKLKLSKWKCSMEQTRCVVLSLWSVTPIAGDHLF